MGDSNGGDNFDGATESFRTVLSNTAHERHRQYRDAIHPKLWACRCRHPGPAVGEPEDVTPPHSPVSPIWLWPLRSPLCPRFEERYELIAYLGSGSFGSAWAARTRGANPVAQRGHFAVKFASLPDDPHEILELDTARGSSNMIKVRYKIPLEAMIHALVDTDGSDISRLVEVYWHGKMVIIVMELCAVRLDRDLFGAAAINRGAHWNADMFGNLPRMRSCTGARICNEDMVDHNQYQPLPTPDVARIFHCVLRAIKHMFDLGCTHLDMAGRNILIEEDYKAVLIDFGFARLHPTEDEFLLEHLSPKNSCSAPPEDQEPLLWKDDWVGLRRQDIWVILHMMYMYLNNALPWDISTRNRTLDELQRMLDTPLAISETVTQDAVDVLQLSLQIYPDERPTADELACFPWFNGWQEDLRRDFQNPRIGRYHG